MPSALFSCTVPGTGYTDTKRFLVHKNVMHVLGNAFSMDMVIPLELVSLSTNTKDLPHMSTVHLFCQ